MQTELRKTDRIELRTQPEGELYLLVDEVRHSVNSVLDISPQGIRVQLATPVSDFKDVIIQYRHKEVNLNVNGTIAWNMPSEAPIANKNNDPVYDVGINLLGPHLLFSLMQP